MTPPWQLDKPIDAICFDCDGTLSTMEGIDELAKMNAVGPQVAALTAKAMGTCGLSHAIYDQRLKLVSPTKTQTDAFGQTYYQHRTPDIKKIIEIYTRLNKTIYIISAGLQPSVSGLSELLGVPSSQVYAVNIYFDLNGHYLDYDRHSVLVNNSGKRQIIKKIKKTSPRLVHVGDGLNDLAVQDLVTRFVGYGGVFFRENIAAHCHYYIYSKSLAPLLPLTLTQFEYYQLDASEKNLFDHGLDALLRSITTGKGD